MNLPFYNEMDVSNAIQMQEGIDLMRDAFIALSDGTAIVPNRINLPLEDRNALNLSMPAYIKRGIYNTIKLVNINFDNPEKGLPLINGIIVVMDSIKGNPTALIDGKSVTSLRTGASSGLATDLLSNKDSKCAFIFGTGAQAKTQIDGIRCVLDCPQVGEIVLQQSLVRRTDGNRCVFDCPQVGDIVFEQSLVRRTDGNRCVHDCPQVGDIVLR